MLGFGPFLIRRKAEGEQGEGDKEEEKEKENDVYSLLSLALPPSPSLVYPCSSRFRAVG